jgi:hypothetical protein
MSFLNDVGDSMDAINIYAGRPRRVSSKGGSLYPLTGDLTGMTEPCGALPRKCLFIYGSLYRNRRNVCQQTEC